MTTLLSASTTSTTSTTSSPTHDRLGLAAQVSSLDYLVPIGRAFFALIFLMAGLAHALQPQPMIPLAEAAGVPLASLAVPLAGAISFAGGLSILLGYKTRIGALLLVLFLVPVTFSMHKFWGVTDPMMAQIQQVMFMKNIAMLGGALLFAHFGAGPVSLDARASSAREERRG